MDQNDLEFLIDYSDKYSDATYEYRHVTLPHAIAIKLPNTMRLLTEKDWRRLGVSLSPGWVHYDIYKPEPHVLLFRRPRRPLQNQQIMSPKTPTGPNPTVPKQNNTH
jgi:cyclin-dependent kinase regulatory subunit CKS1